MTGQQIKIDQLTPEQWAYLREFREEQRQIALNTDPMNPNKAIEAVKNLYVQSGLRAPRFVFLFESPLQCLIARSMLKNININERSGVIDMKARKITDFQTTSTPTPLRQNVVDDLNIQLQEQCEKGTTEEHKAWIAAELERLRNVRIEFQSFWFIGGLDKYWLSFYEFGKYIGIKYSDDTLKRLAAYQNYAETCGIAFLYEDVAFVSDRFDRIMFDNQRRLHCDDGPTLSFRDGYKLYAWHGQRVDAKLIEGKRDIKAQDILNERNAELRRIMMEIYTHVHGADRVLTDLNAKEISRDVSHGRPRVLYQIQDRRYVYVQNGSLEPDNSRRTFILGTTDQVKTPHEAVAFSYGINAELYKEAIRT